MKKILVAAALAALTLDAQALSLREAALKALDHDPRALATKGVLRASQAQVDVAETGYKPSLTLNVAGGRSELQTPAPFPQSGMRWPNSANLLLSQPLYTGGLTGALVEGADAGHENARQQQRDTGGKIILAAVTAYLDVVRDGEVVRLNQTAVSTLTQAAGDAEKRYQAGEATTTDVAQARARVAEAQAGLQRAISQQRISEAGYQRVVGEKPQNLRGDWPGVTLPASLEEATQLSASAPFVLAAQANARYALAQKDATRAERMPRMSVDGQLATQDNSEFGYDRLDTWSVQFKLQVPIYEGGLVRAKVESADGKAEQASYLADDARAQYAEMAAREWASLQAADEVIRAYEAQVQATELALDGVRKERDVGTRTTLDLLDAEREQLAAQVNLLGARRDRAVTAFKLLAVCGKLEPEAVPN